MRIEISMAKQKCKKCNNKFFFIPKQVITDAYGQYVKCPNCDNTILIKSL